MHSNVKRKHFRPRQHTTQVAHVEEVDEAKPTISIPHNKFVQQFVKPVFSGNNFRVVNPSLNSLRSNLVHNKPRSISSHPDPVQCAGVYSVPCRDCGLSYYGETGRSVEVRLGEHKSAVRNKDIKNACYKHVSSTNHNIDWNNSNLIFHSEDWYRRLVIESSCIVTKPNYNNMRSTLAIDKFSASLILNTIKPRVQPP